MERIIFDVAGNPEMPTLILMTKGGRRIGMINNFTNFHISSNMNAIDEISFVLHKYSNGNEEWDGNNEKSDNNDVENSELETQQSKYKYWNEVKDFRIIYAPEWKQYFEISVSLDDNNDVTKTVNGTALQETELSHINLYEIEINTEADILRDDYEVTVLYNPDNPKASLLNRILADKCSHYKILHVDSSIANIQRTFSFNDISIYDAFMEISKEINCLFVFGEESTEPMFRTISVYDLESSCNDCGYRGEFEDQCPKCSSTNILSGYGEDTTIFINKENLGENINIQSDTGSVNNCFRLEAGDDLMTATIVNCNPAGSQYIWLFTDEMKADMSEDLVNKLNEYDSKYEYYENEYVSEISEDIVAQYNQLIKKYKNYNEDLTEITLPIIGYSSLINLYYDVIDFYGYLYNSLLPSVEIEQTTAQDQADLLTTENLSPVAVQNADYISLATANSTITAYAKVIIDSARYKIKVKNSSIDGVTWTGNFTVESYYDDEDTAESKIITVTFNDNYEDFLKQQIEKTLAKSDDEDFSIVGMFNLENNEFANELQKYSYTHLQIISDACQSCLNILIEQGVTEEKSWDYTEGNVYEEIYVPFYEKMELITQEIQTRESEINILNGIYDEYGDITTKGIRNYIDDIRSEILSELDFQTFIGKSWAELSSFRRESTWTNSNYISDGLTNKELFENAIHFLEAANKDIYKSANIQHSITSTLKNLLVLQEFEPLVNYFKTGNWMRIEIDGVIYKLRLVGFDLDYDNLNNLDVEFSDVVKKLGVMSDIDSILSQSQSIAKSYSSTKRQAKQGSDSKGFVDNWIENGINATTTKIINSADQQVVYDEHGMLFRQYDEINQTYSPLQMKIINSVLAMTNDNWKTAKVGVGEFEFYNPKTQQTETGYGIIANQIVGSLLLSEEVGIYNETGSMVFDDESGLKITNGVNTFSVNPNEDSLLEILNGDEPVFSVSASGELTYTGNVNTKILSLGTSGLQEGNDITSIQIIPSDVSILTLSKGEEKLLYFDEFGELYIKANITAQDFVFEDNFLIGEEPSLDETGVSISNIGILSTSFPALYNPTILSSYDNYYSAFNYDQDLLFFAGGADISGTDSVFKVMQDGHIASSSAEFLSDGFSIVDEDSNNVFWFDEEKTPHIYNYEDGGYFNFVMSDSNNKVKFVVNKENDNLEIWINGNLYVTFPKGYIGVIESG